MSRFADLGSRLYNGEVSYDFVGRWRRWYVISAVILLVSVGSLVTRGLNLGIEFEGGATFTVQSEAMSVEDARSVAGGITGEEVRVTVLTTAAERNVRVETPPITPQESQEVRDALAAEAGVAPDDVNVQQIGPTWGDQITKKAVQALIVFLLLIAVFLSIMYEWRVAVAALVALLHDLVITVGVYALIGFVVTPATVIGILTILGYSLYDTVVVFDKVRENTRGLVGLGRQTYSQAANLAVNQTLVRSMNTSITTLLPISAILFIGTWFLGAGVLKDLALALFVGIAAGTYSSIFIATPLLAQLKEREPAYRQLARRVAARQGGARKAAPAARSDEPVVAVEPGDEPADGAPVGAGVRSGQARIPQPKRPASRPRSKRRPSGKKRR